jgi:LCP family protein required for cell wall assembly
VSRRAVVAGLCVLAAVAGTAAALPAGTAAAAPTLEIGRAHADHAPVLTGDDPVFILVLGSDARPGTEMDRGLCDSIHILGIDPASGRASLVGIPRDSFVPLSTGGSGKINSAMPEGGAQAMVDTVEDLTGITFDYYVLTNFDGFVRAVNAVGGLAIDAPYAFDGFEGTTFEQGNQTLDGGQALEFARTRKSLSHGDFDRSMNQGRLMLAALGQFKEEFAGDPAAMFRWIGAGMRNVATDIPLDELLRLGFTAATIAPKRVTNLVAVGTVGEEGGISIVRLPDPHPMLRDVAKDGYVLARDIPPDAKPAG